MKVDKTLLEARARIDLAMRRARYALVSANPFFATLVLGIPQISSNYPWPASTDGQAIYINPDKLVDLVPDLSPAKLAYVMAHECLHVALGHCWRGVRHIPLPGGRKPHETDEYLARLSGIACDYVVNDMLDHSLSQAHAIRPLKGCFNSAAVTAGGGTAEGVFLWLREQVGNQKGEGDWYPDLLPPKDSAGEGKGEEGEAGGGLPAAISDLVARAIHAGRAAGNLPAGLARLVGETLDPKLNWRVLLHSLASGIVNRPVEVTWARPNRRMLWSGVYLPAQTHEPAVGRLSLGVDCSGSVADHELRAFTTEIQGLWDETPPAILDVMWFESEVAGLQTFEHGDCLDLRPVGCGGTAFSPVIKAAMELDPPPDGLVMLTDLGSNDFGPPPPFPVLWVVVGSNARAPASQAALQAQVPYGKVAAMLDVLSTE